MVRSRHKYTSEEVQRIKENSLQSIKKIIKYQEKLYNLTFKNGKWIRRYNAKNKTKKQK